MSNVKVSVIVPVYNADKYLDKCLDSILNQTLKDIEVLCINDGSTDNSLTILNRYAKKYDYVKILTQNNKGPGSARNKGLNQVTGKYISFVDADDWLEEDALEILYNKSIKNDADLLLFNSIEHKPNNQSKKRIYNISNEYIDFNSFSFDYKYNKRLVLNSYLIVCTKLHKTSFLRENNIEFSEYSLFEDVLFHVKSMINAKRISYDSNIFYNYRRTDDKTRQNISINTKESFIIFDIFNEIETLLFENNIHDFLEINFISFKLTELENIFNNINPSIKENLFLKIKKEFRDMNLSQVTLSKLSFNNKLFYIHIYYSNNITEFNAYTYFNALNAKYKNVDFEIKSFSDIDDSFLKQFESSVNTEINYKILGILIQNDNEVYEKVKKLKTYNNMLTSAISWKITKPLRILKKIITNLINIK